MSSEEPRDRESPISVSAENRLRELLRARALRKEREKEEQQMESVYSPRIKKVYKGHRNSRTMVSNLFIFIYSFLFINLGRPFKGTALFSHGTQVAMFS